MAHGLLPASRMRLAAAVLVLASLPACNLYFNHGGDDCPVFVGEPDIAAAGFRNPQTGECEPIGGFPDCPDPCGICAWAERGALPDWGACFSQCDTLDEQACLTEPGCRAAYTDRFVEDGPPAFRGCWAVAQSGPIQGACNGLDAQECSRHDDCVAFYADPIDWGSPQFQRCAPEPGVDACASIDCGPGTHCEQQCAMPPRPDGGVCDQVACPPNSVCVEVCPMDPPQPGCEPGQCHAECRVIPPTPTCESAGSEAECTALNGCAAIYTGTDCTCDMSGNCDCKVLTYDRCISRP